MKGPPRGCRVLLIAQEGMLREGLRALIDSEQRLSVTHLVGGTEGLRALAEGSAAAPDIIVVDLAASAVNPRETVELARKHWPHVPILVPIPETAVEGLVDPAAPGRRAESDGLSERERQVLKLVAAGLRTREIAEKLCVSFKTVDKHRTNIMRKLGVRTAAAVAAYAILNGYYP